MVVKKEYPKKFKVVIEGQFGTKFQEEVQLNSLKLMLMAWTLSMEDKSKDNWASYYIK